MDIVRLATPQEIAAVAVEAGLTPTSQVVKCGEDWAVLRQAIEIDPLIAATPRRKVWLASHLEAHLRLLGVPMYFFQVAADDVEWQQTVEAWGASKTSKGPEFRYRKDLK